MKLKKQRPYKDLSDFEIYDIRSFTTLNTAEEELWLQLERLTNKAQANDFLYSTLGHKKGIEKEISPILSEFVKQGKAYYTQAERADFNVSPLLYYYGMLNLVKAYILSRDPYAIIPKVGKKISSSNLSHGISAGDKIKQEFSLHAENIELQNNGIFCHYYNLLTGRKISNLNKSQKTISIISLLSYCADISSEFEEVFRNRKNTMPLVIQIAQEKDKAWIRLLIKIKELKTKSLNYKTLSIRNPDTDQYQRVKSNYPSFCLFEEKTTFLFSNKKNLQSQTRERIKSLKLIFSAGSDQKIGYKLPLIDSRTLNILLPECLNIYLAMYYFGSVVRYQPYAFKKILPLKEGLVIQSFIRTCPKKFLRLIVATIFEKLFIFDEI